jgi:hypothetical protein
MEADPGEAVMPMKVKTKAKAKRKAKSKAKSKSAAAPSKMIFARFREHGDWRGETLARMRALIQEAEP